MDPSEMYGGGCQQQFSGGFLNPTTAAMLAAATARGSTDPYGSLEQHQQQQRIVDNSSVASIGGGLASDQSSYVSAAAYAAAAGFGAFLNPHQQHQQSQHHSRSSMDTYPLTAHMQSTDTNNPPSNGYAPYEYQYYQHYQPVQSPADFQGNYILQTEQNSPMSIDGEDGSNSLSHTARTSPATLIWLSENYEPCEGSSLPRCTLYTHYKRHCAECDIDPVNPASFGKLIRSVFRGLKTRRLGTRGNSKYHYYGIRIKPNSPYLNEVDNDRHMIKHGRRSDVQQQPSYATRAATAAAAAAAANTIVVGNDGGDTVQSTITSTTPSSIAMAPTSGGSLNGHPTTFSPTTTDSSSNGGTTTAAAYATNVVVMEPPKSYEIHEPSESFAAMMGQIHIPTIEVPNFEEIEAFLIPADLEISHANKFIDDYIAASTEMLHLIEQQRFKSVENLWLNFWSGNRTGSLTQEQMFNLLSIPDIYKTIDKIDQLFYQSAVDLLMPNVFAPISNMKYLTAIRNFVKQIVPTFKKALEKAPHEFMGVKIASGKAFAHRMKRYTAIHHLSDAARAVLSHPKQVETMYNEFCRIDVASIQEQAGWVCECDPLLFNSIFNAFKENLKAGKELETFAEWMEAIVDQVLAKYHDQPLHVQVAKSKQLIHDWNYYSSAIIRDLTLRSANSFGSFHLLKILFEDYIFYLVELRLAKVANTPVVCLLSRNWIGNSNLDLNSMDYGDSNSTTLQSAPVVTQMIMHDSSVTSSNIQYVVTDQPKYVFSNNNGYLMTSSTDDYVMVSTSEGHHYVDHQLMGNGTQQLETIVYVDEHGQQTTADNSAAQYIVMTGLPSVTSANGESIDIENANNDMGRRRESFDSNVSSAKRARTADEMVLSGDILEANVESPRDEKQS